MARDKKAASGDDDIRVICRNRRALHEYEVFETLECGLVLTGTEVKSLRDGHASLEDAYAKIEDGELWLLGSDGSYRGGHVLADPIRTGPEALPGGRVIVDTDDGIRVLERRKR